MAKTKKEKEKTTSKAVQVTAPKMQVAELRIRGTAPYVQNKFSQKAKDQIRLDQEAGSTSKTKKKREPKDFDAAFRGAQHVSHDGWVGIPAGGLRAAMISACRLVGFTMTRAKLAIFVIHDGLDAEDDQLLVKIVKGEPRQHMAYVRNESGVVDLRCRPMWDEWEALLRVEYDTEQFTLQDVTNLVMRVGKQVGIGEGRPDSKKSTGMGWGTFEIVNDN